MLIRENYNFQYPKQILLFVFISHLIIVGCKGNDEVVEIEKAIPVAVTKVKEVDISIPIHTSGKIKAKAETKLSFKTGGAIEKIFVEEGQAIRKGQILARLDLGEINAKVLQAKAGYTKAERDNERVATLYKDSVVTLEQYQNVKTALEVAKSNLEIANFNLNYSTILAPSNGKIFKKFVEENELVGPGNPIFIFGSTNSDWVMVTGVTDKDISKITKSDTARITLDAFPNKIIYAVVYETASASNPYTSTYEIELRLLRNDNKIMSGMVGNIKIYPSSLGVHKVIPIQALVNADGMKGSIYTISSIDSSAVKVNVEISEVIENDVIIQSGLETGDYVITDGVEYLSEGMKVKVIHSH